MAYATKDDLELHLAVEISADLDAYITALISACEDYVERACGNGVITRRVFDADEGGAAETRYYDYKGGETIVIDDVRELTSISLSGFALTENEDYILYPLNEEPKEYIKLYDGTIDNSRSEFVNFYDKERRAVEVVAKFGYSTTVPAIIKLAVMSLAGGIIRQNTGDTSMKQITSQSLGSHKISYADVERVASALDVNGMIEHYKRNSHASKTATIQIG